jgi:glycosyltransferase domain-containing protein
MSLKDFTLVIPTYNRPDDLRRNLLFHDAQGLQSRVLVLDSSTDAVKAANRRTLSRVELAVEHVEYSETTHPFDKFGDGVGRVNTLYCALCADDDLLLHTGLRAALKALAADPDVAVAHGYYFLFGQLQDKTGIDLTTMLYASPGIVDDHPLVRLRRLMHSYQALTYGVYRSSVLKDVYRHMTGVGSLMFRELLSSALPLLAGKAVRVPDFYGARAHATGDDARRTRWHPLEWFMRDSADMIREYARYRRALLGFARGRLPNGMGAESAARIIDTIHFGYLARHMPDEVQEHALAQEMKGRGIDDYWGDAPLQHALIKAHNSAFGPSDGEPLTSRVARAFPAGTIDPQTGQAAFWPLVVRTPARDYRFHQGFLDNSLSAILDVDGPMINELMNGLDNFPQPRGVTSRAS